MEVKLREEKGQPLTVEIIYPEMTTQVQQLIQRVKSFQIKLSGSDEEQEQLIDLYDIYYIESVERKTFIYTKEQVLRSSKKLYQLAEQLKGFGFVQINKGCLLNINVLDHVRTLFNSRLEATLINKEKLIITRTYIPAVKKWLEGEAD